METLKRLVEYFQGLFEIIFSDAKQYQYSLKDVDLKVREGKYDALIKYILIGCRKIQHDSAINLLKRRTITKFNDIDAEIITTIHAAIILLNSESKEDMVGKITLYLKQIKEKKITKLQ